MQAVGGRHRHDQRSPEGWLATLPGDSTGVLDLAEIPMRARDDVVAVGKRRDPTGADAVSRRGAGQRGEQLPGLAVEEIDGAGVDDVADNSIDVKLDDCDVFKCELASLGRKAYNLVTELREAARRRR